MHECLCCNMNPGEAVVTTDETSVAVHHQTHSTSSGCVREYLCYCLRMCVLHMFSFVLMGCMCSVLLRFVEESHSVPQVNFS